MGIKVRGLQKSIIGQREIEVRNVMQLNRRCCFIQVDKNAGVGEAASMEQSGLRES